ncbi:hypothetical protein GLOIN_2v1670967 [Rhizophagus irregularis DAOM 181602=DAOM 197198]|uniref:Uncharacterized protein n=1 Tax=Rhizophagus irregularis (strain DAOM 181602 / DAOM 197198 / MUCL 43194) TaxID=747089 RepID=A0A2P4PHP4_RHIID|nr:hypothetical protein GLOIN_2v1670967 [Rhizophagus irregularis DAOM 181602=DAOM 197198]POG64901.1 hypothetical protein GLOIN_2v1670967 [Rhizophagus irregularis DAOM 181602=DAOM 197198]|eukprot:XP_025171767.1 hypothetical protein GLOIN_2v1670967 [Rhizophagus irregularis DAOM 181602=DAOM 197198]
MFMFFNRHVKLWKLKNLLVFFQAKKEKFSDPYMKKIKRITLGALIDYFICKWNKKVENLKFMYLVSNLLPYLVKKSYKIQMDELIPKLNYVEIPEVEFKSRKFSPANSTHKLSSTILTHNKFSSTREIFGVMNFLLSITNIPCTLYTWH